MPHQCVRCGTFYADGSQQILTGCNCGAKLFFFIRAERLEQVKKELPTLLPPESKKQIEEDVLEMVGGQVGNTPVVLDFESIRVLKPGKYELDLVKLFKDDAVIFKLEDGKYVIDVAETFQRMRRK